MNDPVLWHSIVDSQDRTRTAMLGAYGVDADSMI